MLPEWVAASSLEELAARGEAAMLESGAISAADAEEYLNALTALPTLVPVVETIDIDDAARGLGRDAICRGQRAADVIGAGKVSRRPD